MFVWIVSLLCCLVLLFVDSVSSFCGWLGLVGLGCFAYLVGLCVCCIGWVLLLVDLFWLRCLWFVNSVGLQFFAVLITCGGLIML